MGSVSRKARLAGAGRLFDRRGEEKMSSISGCHRQASALVPGRRALRLFLVVLPLALALSVPSRPSAQISFVDVNPDVSTNSDPDASTGGRVNGLASVPGSDQIFYAASEFGGLFKTTDGGMNWVRLNRHLPTRTIDVAVDPSNTN